MHYKLIRSTLVLTAFLLTGNTASAQRLKFCEKRMFKRLQYHIEYLASDRLEGRATGSQGEQQSAEYLAAEFADLGLAPLGDNGSFMQIFEITTLRLANDADCQLIIDGNDLKLNVQYYPLSYSSNHAHVKGKLVDCGFGINGQGRNDFEGVDINGNIALINASSPDGIHPHSKWSAYHGIQIRVDEAISQGATGVVFYTTDQNMEEPSGELSTKMAPSNVPVVYVKRGVLGDDLDGNVIGLSVGMITDTDKGHNVLAFADHGAEYTIVIGAHHDHLGHGEHGGSLATGSGEIHNGADDNASGTAGLLELARKLRKSKKWNRNYNYLFVAFSGEEMGLLGSKYLVDHFPFELSKVNCMLNMDMIGMLDSVQKTLVINGVGTSPVWPQVIDGMRGEERGIEKVKTTSSGIGSSDHTSFYLKGVPSVHFFTGQHKYYHKPTDDIVNLNFGGTVFVLKYMLEMIEELNDLEKMEFTKTVTDDSHSRRSFSVTLGIIPDYVFDGEGMRVDGVKPNEPGAAAGLNDGDVIISLNGTSVKSIMDYMKILGSLEAGDKSELQVLRDGEVVTLQVQF